jgi:hypothetical protein
VSGETEFQLHRACAEFLDWALPSNAYHTAVDAGAHSSRGAGAKAKARGVKAGFPDHLIFYAGRLIAIEFKTAAGKVSPAQHECHARLRLNGVLVYVCRSVESLRLALEEAGVPLRARLS